ncbi:MAG: hypothetical protein ACLFU4_05060 [Opitutales bacterium]
MQKLSSRQLLLLVFVFGYAGVFAIDYASDVLAHSPVLDARENLALAAQIDAGQLAQEPFYRAMLYPWLLSILPEASRALFAAFFGLVFHFGNAALCGLLAYELWRRPAAAWFAGVLYSIYPVSLFFAVQVLDITPAITLFLAGCWTLLRGARISNRWLGALAGLCGGLAVLLRPNLLPAVLLYPLVFAWLKYRTKAPFGSMVPDGLIVAVPLLICAGLQGGFNAYRSGEVRILPWQGSYNLYAANRPGANGKYFEQQIAFADVPVGANTTRMESERLYQAGAGDEAPQTVAAMNRYWRGLLFREVWEDPAAWLALMGRKVVYLLNNWEQYNNLTYAFHKARFTALAWNPLGWGLLLMGAALALALNRSSCCSRREVLALAAIGLAYAAGVLMFFVSARFRLPLAPLLVVFAGGLACVNWRDLRRCDVIAGGCILAVTAGLSFGNWLGAQDKKTFRQDHLLLAQAALNVGDDEAALLHTTEALELAPEMQSAVSLQVVALFNLWLEASPADQDVLWSQLSQALQRQSGGGPAVYFIRGVYLWRTADPEGARAVWREALRRFPEGAEANRAALEWVSPESARAPSPRSQQIGKLLPLESR